MRVLLVEDNPSDVLLLDEVLQETPEIALESAPSLAAGIAAAARAAPDVLLLDLNLPDGHGLQTVRRMARAQPALPIVVVSGFGGPDAAFREEALALGADAWLAKGCLDAARIQRTLVAAIGRRRRLGSRAQPAG